MEGDLFDILSMDERIIVLSCVDERCFYTWNQADTLQCFEEFTDHQYGEDHALTCYRECGILTKSGYGPKNYKQAREQALAWHNE